MPIIHSGVSLLIDSTIWDLGEYCQKKQSEYQKMGIKGRWQVTPDELEPPHKKTKLNDTNLEEINQLKVCNFIFQIESIHSVIFSCKASQAILLTADRLASLIIVLLLIHYSTCFIHCFLQIPKLMEITNLMGF